MPTLLPDVSATTSAGQPTLIRLPALTAGATLASHGQPASGTLALNPDRTFTYAPAAGFVGGDQFVYVLGLAGGDTAEGRVVIAVVRPNTRPVAGDDAAATAAATAVVVAVLANDADPDGDTLRLAAVATPAHGTVTVEPDQRLRYAPQTGFAGTDAFSYTVSDGRGGTASATVSVTVERPEGSPRARDDAASTTRDAPVTIPVLANDTDPEGDPLTLASVGLPGQGTISVNPDQTVTYMPKAGFIGADEFTYQVSDGRGGTADARVAVEVRRPNAPPVARNDSVATALDTPVTIAVLGNDTDPDGDQVSLVSIGLPAQGRLAVNADRTITYTPLPGFSGVDEFRYTVTDGWGGTSSARVGVTVGTPPQTPRLFANGYGARRRLAVPAALVRGEHAGFPLWVRLSGAYLRPQSAGGRLAGGPHLDVRFELEDGTKLPHEIDAYDAAAGVLSAWVRLPLLSQQATTRLVLYYAKADLAAPETDAAGVWAGYLAVWHLPSEADRASAGRDLTVAGTVAADPAGGLAGASAFAGAGVLHRDDAASWMSGLSALTVQLRARAQVTGHEDGVVNCGGFGGDGASALTLRYAGAGGALYARLATTAGAASLTTKAGAQSTLWQNLALAWAAGDARLGLFVDGKAAEADQVGEVGTGAGTVTSIAGALVLGAGSRDTEAGGWQGGIDEVRVSARKLPAGWLAAEQLNQATPDRFIGVGADDSPDDLTQSPVAVPFGLSTPVNTWIDVDVLAGAVSVPGPNPTVLTAIGQPGSGVASVIAGKVRYTPTTGFAGVDSFTYTLGAGAKRTTSRITVQVGRQQGEVPVPPDPIRVANASELRQALGRVRPGEAILLAEGTYEGDFTANRAGTASAPIVIQCAKILGATITGKLTVAAADVTLLGLVVRRGIVLNRDRPRVSRCRVDNSGTDSAVEVAAGTGAVVEFCDFTGFASQAVRVLGSARRPRIYRNHVHDQSPPPNPLDVAAMTAGTGKSTSDVPIAAHFLENLVERTEGRQTIELKSSANLVEGNTSVGTRQRAGDVLVRHGLDNVFLRNWVENGRLLVGDERSVAVRNLCTGDHRPCVGVKAGTITGDDLRDGRSGYPISEDARLIANEAIIELGWRFDWDRKPVRTRIEAHDLVRWPTRLPSVFDDVEVSISPTTDYGPLPAAPRKLTAADVGPFAPQP